MNTHEESILRGLLEKLVHEVINDLTRQLVKGMGFGDNISASCPPKMLMDVVAGAIATYNVNRGRTISTGTEEILAGIRQRIMAYQAGTQSEEFVWVQVEAKAKSAEK